jgi:hypothetical protein
MCRMFITEEEHSYKITGFAKHNGLYTVINEIQNIQICKTTLNLGKCLVDWNSRWLISCSCCLRSHNHVSYLVCKDFRYFMHCRCWIFLLLLWVSSLLFCVISCGITFDVWETWRLPRALYKTEYSTLYGTYSICNIILPWNTLYT